MMRVITAIFPPLGLLLMGKPFNALVNLVLWFSIVGTIPAYFHAFGVLNEKQLDKKFRRYHYRRRD